MYGRQGTCPGHAAHQETELRLSLWICTLQISTENNGILGGRRCFISLIYFSSNSELVARGLGSLPACIHAVHPQGIHQNSGCVEIPSFGCRVPAQVVYLEAGSTFLAGQLGNVFDVGGKGPLLDPGPRRLCLVYTPGEQA